MADGIVRLEGNIANQYDNDAILEIAKQGAGTNRIADNLKVAVPGFKTQEPNERYDAWLAALWDRLGGEANVRKVVDDFVQARVS